MNGPESSRTHRALGSAILLFIGCLLLMAGASKFAPARVLAQMTGYGFTLGQLRMIGCGEVITALLLMTPRTHPLGLLLTSSLWGGIICIHMANQEDYAIPSFILAMSWVGGHLRDPRLLAGLSGKVPDAAGPRPSTDGLPKRDDPREIASIA